MDGILERANIPKDAKLAFQGERCRVYQWPQHLFDGSTATFEKIVRMSASTVVAILDGKIIIQEQEQPHLKEPFLSFPGGHADGWEESLLEVAKRELLEETGCISEDWQLITDMSQRHFTIFEHGFYLARNCQKIAEPHLDKGEKITQCLIEPSELKEVMEDSRWRHVDIASYLNKPGNFEKLLSQINT